MLPRLQYKRLNRQRKGGKDAPPQPEGDAPASDAARIEVLTAQLDAANARIEDADKRNNYLLLERVGAAGVALLNCCANHFSWWSKTGL